MKRIVLIILLVGGLVPLVSGKSAYKISLQIDGSRDTMMLMGYYYAQYMYYCDTAYNDGKGRFVFEGTRELQPGLYFFTTRDNKRFADFVVYNEKPFFKMYTDDRNWVTNMEVKGSRQNEVFFNYQRANDRLHTEIDEAHAALDSAGFVAFYQQQRPRLDSVKYYYLEQYPDLMISKMIGSTREPEVPTTDGEGRALTNRERFDYFMAHYFDYMPLDDNFIVRTPKAIFYQHVMDYVNEYMKGMPPDLICPLLDTMLDRSESAPEVFKWLLYNITEKFLQSNVMVYDEVYVHLVNRYFATGKAGWMSPTVIDEQVERAAKWERLLVGKEAPELVLFDTVRNVHSLHHSPGRYTLLLFWSPTCGHCREIIPAVYEVFEQYADSLDMSAFAILTEPDEQTVGKWKRFLAEHGMTDPRWAHLNGGEANVDWREVYDVETTPQIYFIDNNDHTIVAKKLNADILGEICRALMRK